MTTEPLHLSEFNGASPETAMERLTQYCHSQSWARALIAQRPFASKQELLKEADQVWFSLNETDWLEAFKGHPKIGDQAQGIADQEQSGVKDAAEQTKQDLVQLNQEYEKKFGFIFIVFATGKNAEQMRDLLKFRLKNTRAQELKNAVLEQSKITRLRMETIL